MTEEKRITYRDVLELERELLDAPELPKEEQDVKDKKEVLSVLKKGILAYLRKGYSVQAVVETINAKFPGFEITDSDVRKILPKVTRKKRAAKSAQIKESPAEIITGKDQKAGWEDDNGSDKAHDIAAEDIYLDVPFSDNEEAKKLGAKFDTLSKKWFIPAGLGLNLFGKWLPKN
jgi:hypothetical protein